MAKKGGRILTEEHKHKLSIAHKGKKLTKPRKKPIPPFTKQHRAKISKAARGRKHTIEAKKKMSASKAL